MNVVNVEQWVQQYIVSHHLNPTNPEIRVSLVGNEISRNGSRFHFGSVGMPINNIDQWQIVNTIGDGSCLIHSFLILLSNSYNVLLRNDKKRVARAFRLHIVPLMHSLSNNRMNGQPSEREVMLDIGVGDQSDGWLTDDLAEKIALFLGYGLVILRFMSTENGVPAPQITSTDNRGLPYLIIANKGGIVGRERDENGSGSGAHFEAVIRQDGSRISPSQLGDDIEPKKDELFLATMQLYQEEREISSLRNSSLRSSSPSPSSASPFLIKRCDSPRQRKSLVNSISAIEARQMAKKLGIYEQGNTKEELCEKLQEYGYVQWYHKNILQFGKKKRYRKSKTKSRRNRAYQRI